MGWLVFLCYSTQGWAQLSDGAPFPVPLVRCEEAWLPGLCLIGPQGLVCILRSGRIDYWSGKGEGAARRLWSVFPGSLLVMLMVQEGSRGFFTNESDREESFDRKLRSHLQTQEG